MTFKRFIKSFIGGVTTIILFLTILMIFSLYHTYNNIEISLYQTISWTILIFIASIKLSIGDF